jgi:glucokinase
LTYLLGIDLGGSSVKAVAVTPDGTALARYNESFDPDRPLHFAETIGAVAERAAAGQGGRPERIGLSAPGLAARDARSIAFLPNRLPGLENLDWTPFLGASRPVPVLNDAHAALLGEVWQGAARGSRNVILLTLGTGVGGAAMVDGHLLKGEIGRAGHLGHLVLDMAGPPDICNTPGSLEWAIGNCTIRERTQGRFATTHDLIQACEGGDPFAREVWLKSVRALACAVASFINILDPEVVIIGGGIARAGDALFQPLAGFLEPIEWRPGGQQARIVPARMGEFAGAFGAAYNALRQSA